MKTFISNLLLITTSGGGGHLQAAQAKKLEAQEKNPHIIIHEKNILEIAGGKLFGKFMIDCIWNTAQRKGSVTALDLCALSIPAFDLLFWISLFFQITYSLYKNNIDHVIDTQPTATSAITSAVRMYRFFSGKNVLIDKILTELPTRESSHYLRPIKSLNKKNRDLIKLMTTAPLLSEKEHEEDFWFSLSKLDLKQVVYQSLPIRPAFRKLESKLTVFEPLDIIASIKTKEEKKLLQETLSRGCFKSTFKKDHVTITLHPEDKVITLMLGSQPTQQASINYVSKFIRLIKNSDSCRYAFFVFCSDKKFEPIPLQNKIHSLVMETLDYPSNVTIIPMSSQTDETIAPLYFRSNATITKAGGITSMELLSVAQGKIWIHHESQPSLLETLLKKTNTLDNPYKGMPKWEYGNALYLERKKGASLISPEIFPMHCARYFNLVDKNVDREELQQNLSNS